MMLRLILRSLGRKHSRCGHANRVVYSLHVVRQPDADEYVCKHAFKYLSKPVVEGTGGTFPTPGARMIRCPWVVNRLRLKLNS